MTKNEQNEVYLRIKKLAKSKDVQQEAMLYILKKFEKVPNEIEIKRACNNVKTKIRTQRLNAKGLSKRGRPKGNLTSEIKFFGDEVELDYIDKY